MEKLEMFAIKKTCQKNQFFATKLHAIETFVKLGKKISKHNILG